MITQARRKAAALGVAVVVLTAAGCGLNRTPAQIAGDVAHNGTILVNAVDAVQKFIASEEAAGRIPRNNAVDAMEAIGRSLSKAREAGVYLDRLVVLDTSSAEVGTTVERIQAALALVSTDAAMSLVPIGDEAKRKQLVALIAEVNKAIGQVNAFILSRRK